MAATKVKSVQLTTNGSGTATGSLPFAATTGIVKGALAWLATSGSDTAPKLVIVKKVTATAVFVAFQGWGGAGQGYVPQLASGTLFLTGGIAAQNNYGYSDMSGYTTGAILTQYGPQVSNTAPPAPGAAPVGPPTITVTPS